MHLMYHTTLDFLQKSPNPFKPLPPKSFSMVMGFKTNYGGGTEGLQLGKRFLTKFV